MCVLNFQFASYTSNPVRTDLILWKILCTSQSRSRSRPYSPKLASRVTSYRRPLLEQWLPLEANPKVITFCERPGYVLTDGYRRLADFWIRSGRSPQIQSQARDGKMAASSVADLVRNAETLGWACRRLDV
jgi:hypothetical protein